jgi:hypothetical protein
VLHLSIGGHHSGGGERPLCLYLSHNKEPRPGTPLAPV